jgi:hypothetical protein
VSVRPCGCARRVQVRERPQGTHRVRSRLDRTVEAGSPDPQVEWRESSGVTSRPPAQELAVGRYESDSLRPIAKPGVASARVQPTRPLGGPGLARAVQLKRHRRLRVDAAGIARVAVAAVSAGALVALIGLGYGHPADRSPRPAIVPTVLPTAKVAEPAGVSRHSHPRRPRVLRERRTRRVRRPVPRRQPVPAVAARLPSTRRRPPLTAVPVPARPSPSAPALPARVPAGAPPEFF